ncbi:deaminase [Micromonospora tulbaghiae]|uniref:deaminase n=1 Tax=Micromonospora tulbaghiae TaxID=479978 RepID=UPI0033D12774
MVSDVDRRWLREAVETSRLCVPSKTAYAVGAVIVSADGREISRGHSRDQGPVVHAEQSALMRLGTSAGDLSGVTMYSSMEPCTSRRSAPATCCDLIIAAGIGRAVLALPEPPTFVKCVGIAMLSGVGIEVVTVPELAAEVMAINAALLEVPAIPGTAEAT